MDTTKSPSHLHECWRGQTLSARQVVTFTHLRSQSTSQNPMAASWAWSHCGFGFMAVSSSATRHGIDPRCSPRRSIISPYTCAMRSKSASQRCALNGAPHMTALDVDSQGRPPMFSDRIACTRSPPTLRRMPITACVNALWRLPLGPLVLARFVVMFATNCRAFWSFPTSRPSFAML